MTQFVCVAPLVRLPASKDNFTYELRSKDAVQIGTLVEMQFRGKKILGIVIGDAKPFHGSRAIISSYSKLFSEQDLIVANTISKLMNIGVGQIFSMMIGPIARTKAKVTHRVLFNNNSHKKKIGYVWYSNQTTLAKAIKNCLHEYATGSIIMIVPELYMTNVFVKYCSDAGFLSHILCAELSAVKQRALYEMWFNEKKRIAIIGSHRTAYIPPRDDSTIIIIDPTHPSHEQWDGTHHYHNMDITNMRAELGVNVIAIAHSPATHNLNDMVSFPCMNHWPAIIDVSDLHCRQNDEMLTEHSYKIIERSKHPLIIIPHSAFALGYVCADCRRVYKRDAPSQCTQCNGVRFLQYGFGGAALAQKLLQNMLDCRDLVTINAKSDADAWKTANSDNTIVLSTAPVANRLDFSAIDAIIDISCDYGLINPSFDAEERTVSRLRSLSTQIPAKWHGDWIIETAFPHLLAWKVKDAAGFGAWWKRERPLRQKFAQPPFF